MGKELNQAKLAKELMLSDRRIRQLEDIGVVCRDPTGGYDADLNRRRYRLYADRDVEQAANDVEEATRRADAALDEIRAAPSLKKRRAIAQIVGSTIGELDRAMKLSNAMAPDHARHLLNTFTDMVIGRAAGTLFSLCEYQVAGE